MGLPLTNSAPSFHEGLAEAVFRSDDQAVTHSQLTAFMQWCEVRTGQHLPDHAAMDRFSVEDFRRFWRLFLEWSDLPRHGPVEPVCAGDACETARFFPDLRLNYAECLLLTDSPGQSVLTACHADGSRDRFTRGVLRCMVDRLGRSLQRLGVRPGDHVVAIARNNAEAVIACLAAAAIGATFASCAPDMGVPAILLRFAPLEPVVLFGCLRAEPWDPGVPVSERVVGAAAGLPGLTAIIALDDGSLPAGEIMVPLHRLADLIRDDDSDKDLPGWPRHPFNQPLFTMFSSGTTGAPKCIQHGAGGTLLEHVKEHRLHCDLRPGDKLFFQTSCGWMMWNWQLSALASGVEVVLYDGPLGAPDTFWRIVAEERVTVFGTNPAYLHFCEEKGFSPGRVLDLSALRVILSTGSILYPCQYDWVNHQVKAAMPLQSISGGTDIIGCFVLGNPNLPVHRGEAQCRSLGLDVRSLPPDDPQAQIGELVCANPFPSRPLGFHGDADGTRFHAAYFAQNPGFWTHGDLIEATPHGGWRLHGRSDGVLNVRGIRIGSPEIYRILDGIEEILEAMAVEQQAEEEPGGTRMVLLLVLREGLVLDDKMAKHIRSELARCGSPAFVPARIAQVEALPVTFNGKRSEAAARDAVNGRPVRNRDALLNPECLDAIAKHPVLRAPPTVRVSRGPAPGCGVIPDPERLRQELQAICERVLGVAPIGLSDNLLGFGADSLAVVSLLLEIESYAGHPVRLSAFLAAPSIEGLIAVLSVGEEAMTAQQFGQSGPLLRAVGPDDWEQICRFLEESFRESGITAATWRRLFDHEWSDHGRGFILLDGNAVVGFIGAVTAQRQVNGKAALVCNLSSWVVHPQYRGWGMALLASLLEDENLTYTCFTPQLTAWAALMAQRFKPLESRGIAMPPLLQAETLFGPNRPVISFDPAVVRERLTGEQRQIFDDHAPYDCLQLTVSDGSDYAYLVVKRRIRRVAVSRLGGLARVLPLGIPYSDILHCSAPELLLRHLERVKLAILRRQRTAALVADARLFPVQPRGVLLPLSTCYRSASIAAGELDRLYSEIVLLPI
jgi:acetoacetyl-CoA synthetase